MNPDTAFLLTCLGLLVGGGLAAAPGAAQTSPDGDCQMQRTGQLAAGTAGQLAEPGVTEAWEAVPAECQQAPFSLVGSNPGDDFDVRFYDEEGSLIPAHANEVGDEHGTVPSTAVEARITYWAGAAGTYTFEAGPHLGDGEDPSSPVSSSQQLYLKSGPTGVGNADRPVAGALASVFDVIPSPDEVGEAEATASEETGVTVHRGTVMSPLEPQDPAPSSSVVTWDGTDTDADASWRWAPSEGFDLPNASTTFSFWEAASADRPATAPATSRTLYHARLYVDGLRVANVHERSPNDPHERPGEVTMDMGQLDLVGEELRLTLDTHYAHPGQPTAILYDSPIVPSNLSIHVDG